MGVPQSHTLHSMWVTRVCSLKPALIKKAAGMACV